MNLTDVPSVLKSMQEDNEVDFALNGTMAKDGSIKITSVSLTAKAPVAPKVIGFEAAKRSQVL